MKPKKEPYLKLLVDEHLSIPFIQNKGLLDVLDKTLAGLKDERPVLMNLKDGGGTIIFHPSGCKLVSPNDFAAIGVLHHDGTSTIQLLSQVESVWPLPDDDDFKYRALDSKTLTTFLAHEPAASVRRKSSSATLRGGRVNMSRVDMSVFWSELNRHLVSQKLNCLVGERKNYYTQLVRPKFKRELVNFGKKKDSLPRVKLFIELSFNLDSLDSGTAYTKLIIQGGDAEIRNKILNRFRNQVIDSNSFPNLDWNYSSGKHRITSLLAKEVFSSAVKVVLSSSEKQTAEITPESDNCFTWYSKQLDKLTNEVFAVLIT